MGGAVQPKGELAAVTRAFESTVRPVAGALLILLDSDGMIVTWNAGAERVTGFAAKDVVGQDLARLFPEAERTAATRHL